MPSTLFQTHIRRVAREAEDDLNMRKTQVECEYADHPEGLPFQAVVIIGVDNDCCPREQGNSQVRCCWNCTMEAFRDQFQCACKTEDSVHKSGDLTFIGEIQPVEVPA